MLESLTLEKEHFERFFFPLLFFMDIFRLKITKKKKELDLGFCKPNHGKRNYGQPPTPHLQILKSRGMRGPLWVIDAPCSTIESIQEYTIGPIDCNLATPSLQFSGFGEFQGISLLFSQSSAQRKDCWEQN